MGCGAGIGFALDMYDYPSSAFVSLKRLVAFFWCINMRTHGHGWLWDTSLLEPRQIFEYTSWTG